jgi:hypothetical protein
MESSTMPLIWVSISSHGYGHAAQVVPVLNELGRRVPGLTAVLRTTVSAEFFTSRLQIPWEISPAEQDIGCIQRGPLTIDIEATWTAHRHFHATWNARLEDEARAIQSHRPRLVLSNISHLAVAAGAAAGIPVVAMASLSWDQILEGLLAGEKPERREQQVVIDQIRQGYAPADLMIRLTPGCPMPAFKTVRDVAPIAQAITAEPGTLRATVGAATGEPIVLVGFGGIAFESFPVKMLEDLAPYRFLLDRVNGDAGVRVRSVDSLGLPFGLLLASADVLMTKPGYSTVVEAVAHRRPVVYVRRYNFADEQPLVQYLHQHGRAVELTREEFFDGRWRHALDTVQRLPVPDALAPLPTGAEQAAAILTEKISQ